MASSPKHALGVPRKQSLPMVERARQLLELRVAVDTGASPKVVTRLVNALYEGGANPRSKPLDIDDIVRSPPRGKDPRFDIKMALLAYAVDRSLGLDPTGSWASSGALLIDDAVDYACGVGSGPTLTNAFELEAARLVAGVCNARSVEGFERSAAALGEFARACLGDGLAALGPAIATMQALTRAQRFPGRAMAINDQADLLFYPFVVASRPAAATCHPGNGGEPRQDKYLAYTRTPFQFGASPQSAQSLGGHAAAVHYRAITAWEDPVVRTALRNAGHGIDTGPALEAGLLGRRDLVRRREIAGAVALVGMWAGVVIANQLTGGTIPAPAIESTKSVGANDSVGPTSARSAHSLDAGTAFEVPTVASLSESHRSAKKSSPGSFDLG